MTDVETFLTMTLKDAKLSSAVCCEKDAILKKIKALQDHYPQLRQFQSDLNDEQENTTTNTTTTTSTGSLRLQRKQIACSDDSGGE